ncbi:MULTISPECIES: ACT domain-containing protein [unclassified Methanoculleus]|uniref:ACT domain-containing protein n=1 Tax=unclassified Methanoculleus TaxID=2619537 RepID=UPI0025E9EB19|nr:MULTISPECIES: ACT domain-containing protein [unclassified Methanoculleus]MCK9318686.1 ACT domain-containing protein [Methanoculleus sp.]MDD2254453.1 ACT domain-containing protein [Methanoculleus sp.]MDD2787396.1 ACT domain-containing protein [Methanoculleus sp.]MDD3216700.1 ACT domain-containing protein [Methanoculleus sp.]MDD4315061.1 ACT domain-containing protein [Methanoculleus sp.]
MEKSYIVKQISIFSENRPGRLAAIAGALRDAKINIFAFSIAEADGFGVVRALVDRPEDAHRTLTDLGFRVSFTDVIGVKMRDEPGGLSDIASVLGDAGINIEYAYAYSGKDAAVLILRVDQIEDAVRQLLGHGGELLKTSLSQ